MAGRIPRTVLWALYALVSAAAVAPVVLLCDVKRVPPDNLGDFEQWSPTRREVEKTLGVGQAGAYDDLRHRRYVQLFKSRFRERLFAVGIRFADSQTVEILCAAMIPRWDMARIAMMAKEESDRLFAGNHRVRIYETYISTAAHQVGELNPSANGRMSIDFGKVYPERRRGSPPAAWPSMRLRPRPPAAPAMWPGRLP